MLYIDYQRFIRFIDIKPCSLISFLIFVVVAQTEEQEISNLPVAGSIPAGNAKRE